jgi:haloalkane dehalogenase
MVPMDPADPVARVMQRTRERLSRWPKPAFVLFAPEDPILGQAHRFFRTLFPTASDQPEVFVDDAGHFLQEEKGEEIAGHILDFIERTS